MWKENPISIMSDHGGHSFWACTSGCRQGSPDCSRTWYLFGAPTAAELEIAELLCRLLPSLEMVRLVSSGTEAGMSAIRLARGYTGRNRIIKFEGCYHGHDDALLVKAGSGALTLVTPVQREFLLRRQAIPWY